MKPSILAKRAYVAGTRLLRAPLRASGLLDRLGASGTRRGVWLRSLFAIYDLDDMERVGLPWWTFDAIEAVERYLAGHPGARVFEYGCGASTLWLAHRAGQVTSVDTDASWHNRVGEKLRGQSHVQLLLAEPTSSGQHGSQKAGFEGQFFDAFVQAIDTASGPFDVIVIDGRAREACLSQALPHLAAGGIVVFDNTLRDRYVQAITASGLPSRRYDGRAVSLPIADSTTLIAKSKDVLSAL